VLLLLAAKALGALVKVTPKKVSPAKNAVANFFNFISKTPH
jgi:hypothetical protein